MIIIPEKGGLADKAIADALWQTFGLTHTRALLGCVLMTTNAIKDYNCYHYSLFNKFRWFRLAKKGKKHKKKKDKKGRDIKDDESVESVKSDTSIGGGGIVQHFEEPFFILSIFAFIIAIARPFFGSGWIAKCLVFILFILGFLSIYFIYLYSKSEKKNYQFFMVPILIFFTALFAWWAYERLI
ncbi:MAG: hypothetical protein B6U86_06040 [Candidatus Altiarchaeales archaeon ex4484_43]|nr:MAG: hypothetical protein B6U86_06040 [Candidatus Altiarchaeales archaeon ex4484_43]